MDAERCWAGSRKGARKGVAGETWVRESLEEARRRPCNRGGIVAGVVDTIVMHIRDVKM